MLEKNRLYEHVLSMIEDGQFGDVRRSRLTAEMVSGLILSGEVSLTAWLPYSPPKRN